MPERGVLFISPDAEEAGRLARMLGSVSISLDHAADIDRARKKVARNSYQVVLTEATLADGAWTDVLRIAEQLPEPCAVVVTDRLADDRLWAEVLNLGGYDVLAQPFQDVEVQRIVASACLQSAKKPVRSQARKRPAAGAGF